MRNLIALLLSLFVLSAAQAGDPKLSPQENAAQQVLRNYYAALEKKDAGSAMKLWDSKAADFAMHEQALRQFLDETGALKVMPGFLFTRTRGETARIKVVRALKADDAKTGRPHPETSRLSVFVADLRLVDDAWKISVLDRRNTYYVRLFLNRLKTPDDRKDFFRDYRELVPEAATALFEEAFLEMDASDARPERVVRTADLVGEIAEFLDSPVDRGWVRLYRGCGYALQQKSAEALTEIDAALATFRREQAHVGEAVALCRRAQVLMKRDRGIDAVADFDTSRDLLEDLVYTAERDTLPELGYAFLDWADRATGLEKRVDKLTNGNFTTEAIEAAEELLRARRKIWGSVHADVADSHLTLCQLHAEAGQLDFAEEEMATAGKIVTLLYGPKHDNAAVMRAEADWFKTIRGFTLAQRLVYWVAIHEYRRARSLRLNGKDEDSLKVCRAVRPVLARLCGPDSIDVSLILSLEVRLLGRLDRAAEAMELHQQLDALYTKLYGKDHKQVKKHLRVWVDLVAAHGGKRLEEGAFAEAAKAFRVAIELRERLPVNEPASETVPLTFLQSSHKAAEKWATTANRKDVHAALVLVFRAHTMFGPVARYQGGEPPAEVKKMEQARETLRKAFGPDDPAVTLATASLMALGMVNADVKRSLAEARDVVDKLSRNGMQNHPLYGAALVSLSYFSLQCGDLAESGPLIREAIQKLEAAFGKKSLFPLIARGYLAGWYRASNQLEQAIDTQHEVARGMMRLVRDDLVRGAPAGSGFAMLKELPASAIGREHVCYAEMLAELCEMYLLLGVGESLAEKAYQQQETLFRQVYGEGSGPHTKSLADLAFFYHETKKPKLAAEYLDRVSRALAGPARPSIAAVLEPRIRRVRANVNLSLGKFAEAETTLREVIAQSKKLYGSASSITRDAESNLAIALQAQGKHQNAIAAQLRSMNGSQAALENVLTFASEPLLQRYLEDADLDLDRLITLLALGKPDAKTIETLWTWVLRRKGVILDTECRFRESQAALKSHPELVGKLRDLRDVQRQLTELTTHPPAGVSPEQVDRDQQKLRSEEARLEGELKRALTRIRPEPFGAAEQITFAGVRQKLPPNTVLVEFTRYEPYQFTAIGNEPRWGKARYLALVLPSAKNAAPRLIDLGDAQTIDDVVREWRETMRAFRERYKASGERGKVISSKGEKADEELLAGKAQSLYQSLLKPIREHLAPADSLLLVPDGPLHHLPFAALVDEDGKYLIETRQCGYLSSTRDLLRSAAERGNGVVVFAGPDFDLGAGPHLQAVRGFRVAEAVGELPLNPLSPALAAPRMLLLTPSEGSATRGPANGIRLGWEALPGAEAEANDVKELLQGGSFGPLQVFVGKEALEERLKSVRSPRVLHIATHGYYFERLKQPERAAGLESRLMLARNPLLRSGIVLAGANRWRDHSAGGPILDDGWLTAEEAAALDLRGTDLVVLSACEVGLGDVKSGEGVYGLRRTFLYAGARSVMVTLESVPDVETRQLMRKFYDRLARGSGSATALHDSQREVLAARRKAGAAHPFFWATFILVADPRE